jgi:hypothetical protein
MSNKIIITTVNLKSVMSILLVEIDLLQAYKLQQTTFMMLNEA